MGSRRAVPQAIEHSRSLQRRIPWRDLCGQTRWQVASNVLRSLPFLLLSWWAAELRLWWLALPLSTLAFLCGLRQSHDAFHDTTGLPRRANDVFLFLVSLAMSCACHAHKHAHLRHHRDPLGSDDAEGFLARWSAPAATAAGLLLYVRVLREGLRADRATRRWVTAEVAGILAMALAAVLLDLVWLRYQLFVTLAAHSVSSFFTVWTVHHGCTPESGGPVARTERRAWMAWISLNLFYHLEHHLFPKVPVSRLPELAARLDAQAPAAARLRVLPELRCPLRACSRGAGRLPLRRA